MIGNPFPDMLSAYKTANGIVHLNGSNSFSGTGNDEQNRASFDFNLDMLLPTQPPPSAVSISFDFEDLKQYDKSQNGRARICGENQFWDPLFAVRLKGESSFFKWFEKVLISELLQRFVRLSLHQRWRFLRIQKHHSQSIQQEEQISRERVCHDHSSALGAQERIQSRSELPIQTLFLRKRKRLFSSVFYRLLAR